jgi:outer membrane autotransporter protein
MNRRTLTECLLATTSVAALILAASTQEASAACTFVGAGQAFVNSGSLPCVNVSTNAVSVTNTVSGFIGGTPTLAPIHVGAGGSLSGSIINSGVLAPKNGDTFPLGMDIHGPVAGITNSGTISIVSTAATAITGVGIYVPATSLGPGGIVNSGTIFGSILSTGSTAKLYGASLPGATFGGGFLNTGTIAVSASASAATATAVGILTSGGTFGGGITNSGTIAAHATGATVLAYGMNLGNSAFSGGISNSGTITVTGLGTVGGSALGAEVSASTFAGNIVNSGTIAVTLNDGGGSVGVIGLWVLPSVFTGIVTNSGTISVSAAGSGAGLFDAVQIDTPSVAGALVNSGVLLARRTGGGTASGIDVLAAPQLTIINAGVISGTDFGIRLTSNTGAATIDQEGGLIAGTTAISFSTHGDTLNIGGGAILGNITGNGGTLATVNVQPGAGNIFPYAGTISGVGAVNLNSGTLLLQNSNAAAPGGTINTVSYTQAAGGVLGLTVTTATGAPAVSGTGSVNASGTMTLGGTFEAIETAGPFRPNTTYTYNNVLTWGTLAGGFSTVTSNSPLFRASLTSTGSADNLTLSLLPVGSVPGLNVNQQAVAGAIEAGATGALIQIYALNTAQLGPILSALSGEQHTQDFQFSGQSWANTVQILENRLFAGGGAGGSLTTGSYDLGNGMKFAQASIPGTPAQLSDASSPGAGPPLRQQWGVWAQPYGLIANAPSTATSAAYNQSGAGVIFGADNQVADNLVAGVAVDVGKDNVGVDGGGSNTIASYTGVLYGKYTIDPQWYADGLASFGVQGYKSTRLVGAPFSTFNNASYHGQGYGLYGETGYTLRPAFLAEEALAVTPYLGLGYLHTHIGGYTESSITGLTVQPMNANSFTTALGARVGTRWRINDSVVLQPALHLAWQHEWLDDSASIRAAFAQAPGVPGFTATGTAFSRESIVAGAGVTTNVSAATQLFLDYDVQATGGYVANVISGGLRLSF